MIANTACTVTATRIVAPPPPLTLTLSGLWITPKKFAPGNSVVAFNLSRAAGVVFRIDRVLEGKRRQGRCTVTGASRKSGPRCIRYDPVGKVDINGLAGPNHVTFDGRVAGAALPAGRYRLRTLARSGSSVTPESAVRFRVL